MGILLVIMNFFRWVGVRNILIVILGAIVFFFVRSQFFTKTKEQVEVTSLFQKIEYVEQLRLVSYFYEEIVAIGTSDRLQKLVNRAEEEVGEAENYVISRELIRDSLRSSMENAIIRHNSADDNLDRFKDAYFAARDTFEFFEVPVVNPFDKIRWKLDSDASWYGTEVQTEYGRYRAAERGLEAADNRRKSARTRQDKKDAKDSMDASKREMKKREEMIITLIKRQRDKLEDNLKAKRNILQEMEKQSRKLRDDLKKVKNRAIKDYQKAEKEVLDARGELNKKKENLLEAQAQLLDRKGEPLPKLLFVVSTEVTGMVDMKELEFEIDGDSMRIIKMPKALIDSVSINLSDTKRFQTSGEKGRGLFSKAEEGLYFEVYQQMKDALIETEEIVRNKALTAGIMAETDRLAEEYISGMGKSLGFYVSLPDPIAENITGQSSEAITKTTDSLSMVLDSVFTNLNNCAFLQDTIAGIIQNGNPTRVKASLLQFVNQLDEDSPEKKRLVSMMEKAPNGEALNDSVYQFIQNLTDCSFVGPDLEKLVRKLAAEREENEN